MIIKKNQFTKKGIAVAFFGHRDFFDATNNMNIITVDRMQMLQKHAEKQCLDVY
jgi:hypothetical protein